MPEDHSERYWKTIERAYDAVGIYDGVKVFQQQFGQLQGLEQNQSINMTYPA